MVHSYILGAQSLAMTPHPCTAVLLGVHRMKQKRCSSIDEESEEAFTTHAPPDTSCGSDRRRVSETRAAAAHDAAVITKPKDTQSSTSTVQDNEWVDVEILETQERGPCPSRTQPPPAEPSYLNTPAAQPQERRQNQEETRDSIQIVRQFGSTPKLFSLVEDGVRLHVRPGCLQEGQVAGPISIHTGTRCLVQCEGEVFLVSEVVDCRPSGMRFEQPLHLDFRIDVGEAEDEEDREGEDEEGEHEDPTVHMTEQREEYMRDLESTYKVTRVNRVAKGVRRCLLVSSFLSMNSLVYTLC